jgi:hypothetical protein
MSENVPDVSKTSPTGLYSVALVDAPPSPLKLVDPVPAIVYITLVEAVILRTRLL